MNRANLVPDGVTFKRPSKIKRVKAARRKSNLDIINTLPCQTLTPIDTAATKTSI